MINFCVSNHNLKESAPETKSKLFDEKTFYSQFTRDLESAQTEVIIESPFITSTRTNRLIPLFRKLIAKNIKISIFTRDPKEHSDSMQIQAEDEIQIFEAMGIQVFVCSGNFHRKLSMIDRNILWEGSLNILSQAKSREIMRRFEDNCNALEMFNFLDLGRFV